MRIFILSFLFILALAVKARADVQYEAEVHVDVTENSVSEAKKKAVAQAVRDGLGEVILSISTADALNEVNKLNDNQLQHFVAAIMVLMEKTSDVRYIADLKISYNEALLRAYMEENNMPFVVGEEQDVLAVPLLEKADGELDLWGDGNFWRQAFLEKKTIKKGNLNIRTIEKNLGNIAAADALKVYEMDSAAYNELAGFNYVEDIYVLKYSQKDNKIYVKLFPHGTIEEIEIADDNVEAAIGRVLAFFKDVKKSVKPIENSNKTTEKFEVVYSYPKLSKWMGLKKLLENNAQVYDVNIVSMANGKVHFNFKFSGVLEKLQANLELQGYKLRKEGEHYAIY